MSAAFESSRIVVFVLVRVLVSYGVASMTAGCTPMKPGSATFPFFGVDPMIMRRNGESIPVGMREPNRESPQPPASKRPAPAASADEAQRPLAPGEGNGGGDDEVGSDNATEGYLVLKKPWPGMARTIYLNHARFEEVYFKKFPGEHLHATPVLV